MTTDLSPTRRPPAIGVLNQQVGGTDLPWLAGATLEDAAAMVLCHVELELLDVGALGRLPARILLGRVEVVGQVLAIAVAHLPSRRETCL